MRSAQDTYADYGDDNEKYEKRKRQHRKETLKIVSVFMLIGIAQFIALVWYTEENGPEIRQKLQSRLHQYESQHGFNNKSVQQQDNVVPNDNDDNNQQSHPEQEEDEQEKVVVEEEEEKHENVVVEPEDEENEREEEHEDEEETDNTDDDENNTNNSLESLSITELEERWKAYDTKIRKRREEIKIFEIDPEGQRLAKKFQEITRQLLKKRYGAREPYRVVIQLKFQESAPDFEKKGGHGKIVLEMGPSEHIPLSVYTFLEISRKFEGRGGFHRRAPHVLQAHVNHKDYHHLAFQEYSDAFPHVERTVGYAGRPSGPGWYISLKDNTKAHGPGSQQKENPYEADACFGKVIKGYDEVVLRRMKLLPCQGFCNNVGKEIKIMAMNIKIPDPNRDSPELVHDEDEYVFWKEK